MSWGFFPSRLDWAASCFKHDPVFASQAYRMLQACPSDPQAAMLCLELAACWANDNPEVRAMVPGLPTIPKRAAVIPDDVLDHWLEWQRHLGRNSGVLMEQDGFVLLGRPLPAPFIYCGHQARPTPVIAAQALAGFIQIPAEHRVEWLAHELDLQAVATQTVATMPTLTAARIPRELPDGYTMRPVRDGDGVHDYQDVTQVAYEASYGAQAGNLLLHERTLLGHANVQAWVIYDPDNYAVRVITGFVAHGLVGAHAGAAVPSVRGRHFSEPLLATVAAWGIAMGADTLCGIAMPQAVPILRRIGASTVAEYVTYRRKA